MPEPWSHDRLDTLEREVFELLGRDLSLVDLPALRFVLAMQQQALSQAYASLARQEEQLKALEQQLDMLRGLDEDEPWDRGDERRW